MRSKASCNLDLLRCIAVVLVVGQHLCRRTRIEHVLWIDTSSLGLFGVLLFFVHTSLVLMQSMERSGLSGSALFRNFYIRRCFRIYPLSVLTVVVALALKLDSNINGIAGLSVGSFPGRLAAISQLLLVQNILHIKSTVNVLWSLPYEVQMYLLLPVIFVWIRRRNMTLPLLAIWGGALALATLQPHSALLDRIPLLRFMPNFLGGVIAFTRVRTARIPAVLWPPFLLSLVVIFTVWPAQPLGWVLCLLLGMLIPSFAELTPRWLRTASKIVATYSYGIYLSHQFSIWIAFGLLASQPRWLRVGVLISLLATLPVLLYHVIEKPMIQWGVRLAGVDRDQRFAIVRPVAA